jgi:hypothetical protein
LANGPGEICAETEVAAKSDNKKKLSSSADRRFLLLPHPTAGLRKTKMFSVLVLQSNKCGLGSLKITRQEGARTTMPEYVSILKSRVHISSRAIAIWAMDSQA